METITFIDKNKYAYDFVMNSVIHYFVPFAYCVVINVLKTIFSNP